MQTHEEYYIPQYLDTPERWLFWTMDEAIIIVGSLIVGLLLGYVLLGVGAAFVLLLLWKKWKGVADPNIALYMLYWFFPYELLHLKATPPSHYRIYYG